MDEVVSSRFEVYSIITEYEFRQKELAGKLAVFEKLPSIIALSQKIDELHKELYVTQKLTFGKMPQIPPKGPTSKQYNAFKDRKKQALARFTEVEIKPLEIELANRKAEYLIVNGGSYRIAKLLMFGTLFISLTKEVKTCLLPNRTVQ
jgi:hypothetical protein